MPADDEPFLRRASWDRGDKIWGLASTAFYGSVCFGLPGLAGWIGDALWLVPLAAIGWVAFGIFNWRIRARDAGKLLVEMTTEGIRFNDEQLPTPWTDVAWVEFEQSGGRAHAPTQDHVVLYLTDGTWVRHHLDDRVFPIEVRNAVARLAPQIPLTKPA